MRIKHYAWGKFYHVECPNGTTVIRRSDQLGSSGEFLPDIILVRFKGRDIPVPSDPPELLPLLAESGRFGLSLVGEPHPGTTLAGAICPGCGEMDVEWLCLGDDDLVRCENCGVSFEAHPQPTGPEHSLDR
ncbi:MAG: hypothetical protein P4L84_01715 [Isosphaeraceae bacterium]|nr:hypothetical protein [Isosphaeraceae bacterium]